MFEVDNKEKLIKKYKQLVKPNLKTFGEFVYFLETEKGAKQIDFNTIKYTTYQWMTNNLKLYIESNNIDLKAEQLEIFAFIIPKTAENEEYYGFNNVVIEFKGQERDAICVIIEKNLDYFLYSNCTKLCLELQIERGIREQDYAEDTWDLINYLFAFEALENEWY